MYDIIIIGAGPAGLSAGIYGVRANLNTLILDRVSWGGQIALSAEIENYPAVPSVTGPDFAEKMYEQLMSLGGKLVLESVEAIERSGNCFHVVTNKETYETKTVIIAAGLKRRKLGCPGEEMLTGRGVSYCAICDGRFFTGKDVIVVGGGNTAMEDALYMASYCGNITILCRGDALKGEEALKSGVEKAKNIHVLYDVTVKEITGDPVVNGVVLENGKRLEASGVFIAIGYEADSAFLKGLVALSEQGYVIAGEDCKTSVPGIFIAGDLRTKEVRQIVTAAADGAVAALGASNYLMHTNA